MTLIDPALWLPGSNKGLHRAGALSLQGPSGKSANGADGAWNLHPGTETGRQKGSALSSLHDHCPLHQVPSLKSNFCFLRELKTGGDFPKCGLCLRVLGQPSQRPEVRNLALPEPFKVVLDPSAAHWPCHQQTKSDSTHALQHLKLKWGGEGVFQGGSVSISPFLSQTLQKPPEI